MLIDTHAHLWFSDFKNDLEEVLDRAKQAGVEKIIVPGTDLESSRQAVELSKKYPGLIYAAVGVHPEEILNSENGLSNMEESTGGRGKSFDHLPIIAQGSELWEGAVAVGEIGTDASSEELRSCMKAQKELFRGQCEIALEHDLPVIIHTRNSLGETLEVLDSLSRMPRGQFHCFSHDEEGLTEVLTRGFYVSFAGNITWSKRVARLVSLVPDDKLLLETDSPFMKPRVSKITKVPNSGPESSEPWDNRNELANVRVLAELIAQLRGQSLRKIAEMTTSNAIRLFRL